MHYVEPRLDVAQTLLSLLYTMLGTTYYAHILY